VLFLPPGGAAASFKLPCWIRPVFHGGNIVRQQKTRGKTSAFSNIGQGLPMSKNGTEFSGFFFRVTRTFRRVRWGGNGDSECSERGRLHPSRETAFAAKGIQRNSRRCPFRRQPAGIQTQVLVGWVKRSGTHLKSDVGWDRRRIGMIPGGLRFASPTLRNAAWSPKKKEKAALLIRGTGAGRPTARKRAAIVLAMARSQGDNDR
jgi:hypothetical protein